MVVVVAVMVVVVKVRGGGADCGSTTNCLSRSGPEIH